LCRQARQQATRQSITLQIDWMNSLIEPAVPTPLWRRLPRFCQCWLRNYAFAMAVYFGVGLAWAYYIYQCFGSDLFPKANVPAWRDMAEQMNVSFWALPMYSLLPSITEELCERGYTLTYAHVSDVGVPKFAACLVLYMAFVEFGVYWMHRGLHDIPWGYKCAAVSLLYIVLPLLARSSEWPLLDRQHGRQQAMLLRAHPGARMLLASVLRCHGASEHGCPRSVLEPDQQGPGAPGAQKCKICPDIAAG
jgi:hypothetical protein